MKTESAIGMGKCIACRRELAAEATKCAACGSYQTNWRNHLLYVSSIIGIITLAGSLMFFLAGIAPDVRKAVAWKDKISVLAFRGWGHITIANSGDGPVFASHVIFHRDQAPTFSYMRQINQRLEPGFVLTQELPERPIEFNRDAFRSISSDDPDCNMEALEDAIKFRSGCYHYEIFYESDPAFLHATGFYDVNERNLCVFTDEAIAEIFSFSFHDGKMNSIEFPVIMALNRDKSRPECNPE